ncbi:MAG: DUF4364 family protein [Oscillospiraceae bacterium]|nr:DUF4364 family protein [Oscillospiraceae bacterium]
MAKFDAFASGIEIGGLRNIFEIKILICYILTSVKVPMKRSQICDSLESTGLVNYFDTNSAIDELLRDGVISECTYADEPHLVVSEKGSKSAMQLQDTLLPGVRDSAVKTSLNIVAKARSERENKVEIKKVENGYDVTFEIESAGARLFSLTLNVIDSLQAEQLKEGFLKDPSGIYSTIIDKLIK